jgi:ribonuclease HII
LGRLYVVGIDENGLGPRLGALVATAVTIELDAYDARSLARRGARAGIGDSKATAGFGKMAMAESVSLALAELELGHVPRSVDELLDVIAVDGSLALRARCPSSTAAQCWSEAMPLPVFGGDVDEGRRALGKLARAGVRVRRARSALACTRAYNEGVDRWGSKLRVDLSLFEQLMADARAASHTDLEVICGMVGGMRRYAEHFTAISADRLTCIEETRLACGYRIVGIGSVRFEVDSDASHLPVALASMLGKYVRELGMHRQNAFYRRHRPDLPEVSGYHDPVTDGFVDKTKLLRKRLGIEARCFERES